MVKKDVYSVSLVNAETKDLFPEHIGPGGKDYVEVEPNAEYWIRIHCDDEEENVEVYCEFEVDGKKLGFYRVLQCPHASSSDVGIWSKVGNQTTEKAFTVKMMSGFGRQAFWMGKIKVSFYEAVQKGVWDEQPDFVSPWDGGKGRGRSSGKKAVASKVGTQALVVANYTSTNQPCYCRGPLLKSITLQYCTTMGLIHVGVLEKPARWDYHRLTFPAGAKPTATTNPHLHLEPEIMTVQTLDPSGSVVGARTHLLFDFTKMDDSDDDDASDDNMENEMQGDDGSDED